MRRILLTLQRKCFFWLMAIVLSIVIGCAPRPMIFGPGRPDVTELDYYRAHELCAARHHSGSWVAFGPPGFVGVVALVEDIKARNARRDFVDCMKAKGFVCTENCPDSSSENTKSYVPEEMQGQQTLDQQVDTRSNIPRSSLGSVTELDNSPVKESKLGRVYVRTNFEKVSLYNGPGLRSSAIMQVDPSKTFMAVDETDRWVKVEVVELGVKGWIAKDWLK